MKKFYFRSIIFWFVLLACAIINALLRELTYKPLLTPYIGSWAHQISSGTGILIFYIAIFLFLKTNKGNYSRIDLANVGFLWIFLTLIFETGMNFYIRHLTLWKVLETYYFWKGETWIFVLLSLLISPFIADKVLAKKD